MSGRGPSSKGRAAVREAGPSAGGRPAIILVNEDRCVDSCALIVVDGAPAGAGWPPGRGMSPCCWMAATSWGVAR